MISDVYKGFYIPKGANIIGSVWAMSRDETRYPDTERFIPENFLGAQGALIDDNPSNFVSGFGRRICPGRYSADASVWSSIMTMLATLDFSLAKDVNGNDITFEQKYQNGITRHPLKFPCCLSPRSHIKKAVFERVLAK